MLTNDLDADIRAYYEEQDRPERLPKCSCCRDTIDDEDYYRFDEARYEVVGQRSRRSFTLGSPVRVMVKCVDMRRRTLDFKLLL